MTRHLITAWLLIFLFLSSAEAANIYVDATCAAGSAYDIATRTQGGGSATSYQTIQAAITAMNGGDDIYIRGGTYAGRVSIPENKTGTAENRCSLADAGGEGTAMTFYWSSGITVSANDRQAVILTMAGEPDSSNYAEMEYIASSDNIPGGYYQQWDSDGDTTAGGGADAKIIFYTN